MPRTVAAAILGASIAVALPLAAGEKVEIDAKPRPRGDLEGMCPHDRYDTEPCAECDGGKGET